MLPAADLLNLSRPSAVSTAPKRAARKLPAASPQPPSVWGPPGAPRPVPLMDDGAHGSPPALAAPKFRVGGRLQAAALCYLLAPCIMLW